MLGKVMHWLVDTGVSQSVTGHCSDFEKGTLHHLPQPLPFDGIGGTTKATHVGQVKLEALNDEGSLTVFEHDILIVPGLDCWLLSPQTYFAWTQMNVA